VTSLCRGCGTPLSAFWTRQGIFVHPNWRCEHRAHRGGSLPDGFEVPVSAKHPETSWAMAARVKGVQRAVLDALRESPNGLSDFDLEDRLGRTHQTTSGARRALVLKGLVEDSGSRSLNRYGSEVIIWRLTDSPADLA
jgi:hypothetical protein